MSGGWAGWIGANAPLLLVAIPLAGAALALLAPNARAAWVLAACAALAAACVGAEVIARVLAHEALPNARGLAPDHLGAAAASVVALANCACVFGAGAFLKRHDAQVGAIALALGLCVGAGWSGALLARGMLGVFVASELAWLALLTICALHGGAVRGALNGALRMYGAGAIAAMLFLIGAALLAQGAGSLDLSVLPLARIEATAPAAAGASLLLLACAIKAGVAPLHAWMGAALGRGGPWFVMCVAALGAFGALGLILRIVSYVAPSPALGAAVTSVAAVLGALSIVAGSLQAIGATNIFRLLAYAGAAQAGAALLAVALGSPAGFAAAFLQIAAMAGAALCVSAGVAASGSDGEIASLDGLGRRAPFSGIAVMIGALSLMGAPLTLGFLGRWRLIEAAVGVERWWAALLVIGASLAGVIYAGRLIERLYFRRAAQSIPEKRDAWSFALAPAMLLGAGVTLLGVEPSVLLRIADVAANHLTAPP